MTARYFVTAAGAYVGAFAGHTAEQLAGLLPAGAVEVPAAPADGRDTWNGAAWVGSGAAANDRVKAQIAAKEAGQHRAMREAVLSGDKSRLVTLDSEIAALRAQLRP